VELAHARNFTISADLLFNLPGQSLDQMYHDVKRAIALGLDHLGLYHLVLFRGLGTAWSREEKLLASLPSNEEAARNWLALREQLLARGFYQTTLTNFERQWCQGDSRRFLYEECSFQPERYDMLGFGPSAISFAADRDLYFADKVLNPDGPADYLAGVERGEGAYERQFGYTMESLKVFYLTRRLAALSIDRESYRKLFGRDASHDFERELLAMVREGLIEVTPYQIVPTPRGMFYADSIAALLAWRQVAESRRGPGRRSSFNDNGRGYM
jgi:oxygen-independent coproporphyrinogen-3 oxidase